MYENSFCYYKISDVKAAEKRLLGEIGGGG